MKLSDIKPGSFGLAVIGGKLGKWIDRGQAIVENQDYRFTHAFIVLDNEQVIEAEPGGAIISPLSKYTSRPEGTVLFSDEPVQQALDILFESVDVIRFEDLGYAESRIRQRIVDFGRELEGTPYNYLDYLAIGLDRFGVRPKLIRKRLARHDRLICSQLVDYVYLAAGIHLFKDGRDSMDVTPGDLEGWIDAHNEELFG